MAEQTNSFLNKLTGLSESKPTGPSDPFLNKLAGGQELKVQKYASDPLEYISKVQNVSGIYTDPLESYREYGVPLNPFVDWNEERANRQSTAEKWANGLTKAGITALGAVYENTVGVFAGLGEMATGGNYYDNFVGKQVDSVNNWAQKNLPNYYTRAEETGSIGSNMLTANFWADKVANGLGYTLGSIATMWLGTGELGLAGRAANAAKALKVGDTALDIAGLGAKAGKVASTLDDAAALGSRQLALYRAGKAIQTGEDLSSLARASRISTASQRLAVATQMSLAEASVEARETKNRFIEEQTAKWEEENPGQPIPADVVAGIEESANAAGNTAFAINLPILATSNLLMFGKMFMGASIGERQIYNLEKDAAGKLIESGMEGKWSKAFTNSKRMFGKPVENMITEGAQEGSQFAASEFSRSYYGDKFHDGVGDMSKSLSESLSNTFGTKEGLENMIIGAIVGGGTGAVSRIAGADSKLAKARTANSAKVLEYINRGGLTRAIENMESNDYNIALVNQIEESNKILNSDEATPVQKAVARQRGERARVQLIRSEVARLDKIGGTDYLMEQLDDAASMPEDEFKKAFGYRQNMSLKDQTGKTQAELVQDIKDKAELSLKRSRQVQDILAKYQPKNTFLPKLLDSLQNEETKQNKNLQTLARNAYANMLHGGLIDIDVIDEQIDNIYDHLIKIAPALGQISKEDFAYKVKVGEVKMQEDGSLAFSGKTKTAADEKLRDKINEVFQSKFALNPADAEDFANAQAELSRLVGRREALTQAFDNIRRNPEQMDLYLEAQQLRKKADEDKANADRATQAIENAETADELREAMPEDAPEEVIAQAETRLEELEKLEKEEAAKLSTMSDDQINAMDEEGLPPIVAAALAKERDKREKKRIAERTIDNATGQLQRRDEFTPTASYEESQQELSDAEAAAFKEISVSSGGFIFTVSGRTYLNLNEDPIDAIMFDQDGNIIGVKLTDAATSNEVTWRVDDTNEQDTAIAESIIYSILLQASSIRSDEEQRNISTAEAQEINRIRGGVITEDVTDKHRKELEAQRDTLKGKDKKFEMPSTEDPEAVAQAEAEMERLVATTDIGKTAGLTDGQIRAQIEVIKQDLIEIEEILAAERQLAMEAGFSKKEFENDGNIKTLKAIKKTHKALLNKKIKELAARKKAAVAQTAEEQEAVVEEIEQAPTEEEVDEITKGELSKISRIEDEIAQLQVVATELKKIADGVYPGQDVEAAKRELRNTQSKINRRKESIRKSNELIQRINEERELEKLRQAGDTAEGTSPTTEGEGIEGTDIDSREGSTSEGLDGTTTNEELEALRKQREELERIDKTMDNPENGPSDTEENPFIETVVVSEGNIDAPLVKGEVTSNENFTEQIVDENGNTSSTMLLQKLEGETIQLFPEMLTDNSIVPTGSVVTFEVDETTDWWNSEDPSSSNNKKDLTEDRYWEQVPIYIVAQLPNGQSVKIGMLAAYNGTTGRSREEIYNLSKKGLAPAATISKKLFNSTNVVNARTESGDIFFYPASQLVKKGQKPTIAVVKLKDDIPTLVDQDENVLQFEAGKLTPGQVAIVVEDPNGNPAIIVASTKDMTEEGRTIAVNHIIKESPEASLFGEIVGLNELPVNVPSEDAAIEYSETEDPTKFDFEKFMSMAALTDGKILFSFYSKSAKKLVRVNEEELKKALLGQPFKFSFSEAAKNERGWNTLVTVQEDKSMYPAIAPNLKQEFLDIIMQKKFQVSVGRMMNTEVYISPITGIEYPSYFDYLTSTQEFEGKERTEGKGANVILATDSPGNAYNSPFYDVGIEFSRLMAMNGGAATQAEIETNRAVKSLDSIDSKAPVAAPKTNVEQLIEGLERERAKRTAQYTTIIEDPSSPAASIELAKSVKAQIDVAYDKQIEDLRKSQPTQQSSTITDKKADIERIRQEKISKIVSKYFPNSKFTDILYHGTRGQERFEKFDENRIGDLDSGYFGRGIYLSPDKASAEGYAKPYNGIVLYAVANLENPLDTDANQANTGITLENNDGAIVRLGEDTLGISEEKYNPNQIIEVVLKKADQVQILSEEESREVDKINAEYNAALAALEGKQADIQNTALSNVESFETSKGSVYTVLPDGKVERFKTAANEKHEPAELIVFVKFENEDQEDDFLSAQHRQGGMKLYVIDSEGNIYNKNSEVVGKNVKLAIIKDGKVLAAIDASTEPKVGYNTFDQRRFEKDGEKYRSTHLGNTITKINYKASPALKSKQATPNVVTVYHHTSVSPQDFNFGNFQRGKDQVSQFGDGLNASTTTNEFFVNRYGNPIQGEVNDSDFIVIDANKSEKELYEELVAKGYKFNNPTTGSYIGNKPSQEYDSNEKANVNPAVISLFNDFQKSNPQVKGVKVINHIIGNQKVAPFYVIYNAKAFYGPGSLSQSTTTPTVQPQAPVSAPMQTASQVNVEEWDADLFGAAPVVEQKPVSSSTELPAFLANYAVTPEQNAQLRAEHQADMQKEMQGINPTGAPMQDLRDLLDC